MHELFSFLKCIFNGVLKIERLSEILMASDRAFHNLVQLGKKEFLYLVSLHLYGLIKLEFEDRSEYVELTIKFKFLERYSGVVLLIIL